LAASTETSRCWAIAHRGTPRHFPENTLAGFEHALRLGCDGIELDVQLTHDDVPVVYHDRTLARAGGGRQRVHRLGLDEVRRLDAGARCPVARRRHRIPLLSEVLEQLAGRTRLLVEIKTREGQARSERHRQLATLVAGMLRGLPKTWVLSFDADVLRTVAETSPRLPRVLNVRPLFPGNATRLRRAMPDVVDADVRGLSPAFGRRVRRGGRRLWSFTCNTPAQVRTAREAGAEALISDRVDWLIERLERDA